MLFLWMNNPRHVESASVAEWLLILLGQQKDPGLNLGSAICL